MNLDGLTLRVEGSGPNSVVGAETLLRLSRCGTGILGRYAGGRVTRGVLVGRFVSQWLLCHYVQREESGELHYGASVCRVGQTSDGLVSLTEHFEWLSRIGHGTNVFVERR